MYRRASEMLVEVTYHARHTTAQRDTTTAKHRVSCHDGGAGSCNTAIQPLSAVSESFFQEWDRLAQRHGAEPYLRPGWITAWWRAFGIGKLELHTLHRNGRLAAVMPLIRRRGKLISPTNFHTPQFSLLSEDAAATTELARVLFSEKPRRVSLAPIDPGGLGEREYLHAAERAGYRVALRPIQRSPYLPLEGTWREYEARLSGNLRDDLHRSERRLRRLGSLSFEIVTGGPRLNEFLQQAFAVEASGWKGSRHTAIQSQPETWRFYSEVAQWAAAEGMLRLYFLWLGHEPLAMCYGLESEGVCHLLKSGYAASYRRYSPGKLLMASIISHAFGQGLTRIELHGDLEPYKRLWADACHEHVRFEAYTPSLAGWLAWAISVHLRPMAKRLLGYPAAWLARHEAPGPSVTRRGRKDLE